MTGARRFLLVREANADDEMDLCVRMSGHDRPDGVKWDDWVKLRYVDTGRSVLCRLKGNDDPSGSVQAKRIHINTHLRRMLGLKSSKVAAYLLQEFRLEKAPSWAFLWYIGRYHPNPRRRREVLAVTVMLGGIILGLIGLILPLMLQ